VTVCYLEPREQSARARRRRIAAQFDFECICKLCSAATTSTDTTDSVSYYAPLEATIDKGVGSISSSAGEANISSSNAAVAAAAAAADDTLAEELDALESAIAAASGSSDRPVAWGSVLNRALM
jgi:hypothetical protein